MLELSQHSSVPLTEHARLIQIKNQPIKKQAITCMLSSYEEGFRKQFSIVKTTGEIANENGNFLKALVFLGVVGVFGKRGRRIFW